jgi:multicomponent Na+:H+ antiporter subunit D
MNTDMALILALAAPLVGAALIGLTGRHPNLRESVTLITATILLIAVLAIAQSVLAGERPSVELFNLIPDVSIAFRAEPLGMIFAIIASSLWIPNSIYSIGYMRAHKEPFQTRYYICFALAITSVMGLAFSANLVTMFIFYETLTLSTYPLVTHNGTPEAKRAGRLYLGLLIGTSVGFQLVAIVLTYLTAGTTDFQLGGILAGKAGPGLTVLLFILFIFGIGKTALMPFHRWLPAAMVAPTPVSALLHAVAVVKGGAFVVLKVVVYVFGLDLMQVAHPGEWLVWLAAFTILLSSFIAMTKDNLKARLAYSTISQLSYIVLGAALATTASITGGGLHLVTHAFGKITLFFCAGAIITATHKTNISEMRGIGRAMPITMLAFLVGSLSVIGLPPFGGAWSKWYLVLGAVEADKILFVGVLMVSSLLNIAYLIPIVVNGFFPGKKSTQFDKFNEAPWACLAPLLFTSIGCLILFVYPDPFFNLLNQITRN